jgi:Holliday junction resolvasome RuvABC endonuclease subunit
MIVMIKIGIDPSINCTGVCVWDDEHNVHAYYMIPSKMTKKMQAFEHDFIRLLPYDKITPSINDYSVKEYVKFCNIYSICKKIDCIIKLYNPSQVYMEGVSYGSVGSAALVDLSFLNASIRMVLKENGVKFDIVSPTSLKKFACANGQADKDVMVDAWKRLDENVRDVTGIKIDDLADSYFLAHYA